MAAPSVHAQAVAPTPVVATAAPVTPPARRAHVRTPGDPLEGLNRALFSVHRVLDRILFRPLAIVYKTVVPRPLRTGIRHVFANLGEPVVFVNDVLQLKPSRAVRTLGRFTVNSTIGIGGLLDVAKGEGLPHHPNGFGNTLGRYGVGPGPYLFIPFLGPTDVRDLAGGGADGAFLPRVVGYPFDRRAFTISRQVLTGLDLRVENDAGYTALLDSAADPYATLRSVYLQDRAAEIEAIRHGSAGAVTFVDPLTDPDAPASGGAVVSPGTDTVTPADPGPATDTPPDPEPAAPTDTPADPGPPPATAQ